jgi:hypothetical protein
METKEEGLDYLDDLQDWQKEILKVHKFDIDNLFENENEIPITKAQANMLEKVLGDDFYISDEKVRETLEAVLELGFYYERDRKILNIARDCYLKGKNWIKRSYR